MPIEEVRVRVLTVKRNGWSTVRVMLVLKLAIERPMIHRDGTWCGMRVFCSLHSPQTMDMVIMHSDVRNMTAQELHHVHGAVTHHRPHVIVMDELFGEKTLNLHIPHHVFRLSMTKQAVARMGILCRVEVFGDLKVVCNMCHAFILSANIAGQHVRAYRGAHASTKSTSGISICV